MITKINSKWLLENTCCKDEKELQIVDEVQDLRKICNWLLDHDRFRDANFILKKIMDKISCQKYAIYAAKKALPIFEKECPEDKMPRKAIRAAEKYLKEPTKKNKNTAYTAARTVYTAHTAARAAAAADAAVYAADCAATDDADIYAAFAASAAVYAAVYAEKIKKQIINYGLKLIYRGKNE